MGASISLAKWMVMGALALFSALLGALPYFLLKKLKGMGDIFNYSLYHISLSILSCIGGGVLLATTLVHMLPENRMSLEADPFVENTFGDHFPIAEILTLVGFALIYFLEEVANFIIASMGQSGWGHGHSHHQADHHHQNGFDLGHNNLEASKPARRRSSVTGNRRASLLSIHAASRNSIQLNLEPTPPSTPDSSTNSKANLHHHASLSLSVAEEEDEVPTATTKSKIGSFFALIALSFHAVMEGIAIGIQNSTNLWLMFGAIASHKFIISFCMGMELCAARAKPRVYIGSILLFAILSPIGILIGSFLTSENSTKSFPVSVLEGFTTGTLLYVVFFEILSREKERRQTVLASSRYTGFLQFLGLVAGGAAMICLLTLTDHGHNSPGEDDHEHK